MSASKQDAAHVEQAPYVTFPRAGNVSVGEQEDGEVGNENNKE